MICRSNQEVISLVRSHGLVEESQAGRSVGYRQALTYLRNVWGFPFPNPEGKEEMNHVYLPQVRTLVVFKRISEVWFYLHSHYI